MRKIIRLNEDWLFRKGEEEPQKICLPHTWNNTDGQDGGNDYWRGTAVYLKEFAAPALEKGERCFLECKGAAMTADVTVNGRKACRHEGGYAAFRTDITDLLTEKNELQIEVDNSKNERVYPQMADFTIYGGLYRDVNLIIVPEEHFELVRDGSSGIKVTPVVDLENKCAKVLVETWHNGREVEITVNGETVRTERNAEFTIENVHLWDGLNDPYLYTAEARLDSGDCVSSAFGCRSFRMDLDKGFFLNGKPYPLRGVSCHQDRIGLGNALTDKERREDMEVIRELGANTLRLAHYQHAQEFYDLCDQNGLVIWAEIPYITKHMSGGKENALTQMKEMITQCYNHPSIVCWGLSNEITASTPVSEELLQDHKELNELCHRMDPTRPTVMAHVFMLEKDSPLIPVADMASFNLYFGWYLGELKQNEEFFDEYHAMYPDRVVGFSEYGADANTKYHSSHPEQGDYTEEYQCVYHEHMLKMIEERPYLWATHVWNLFDFAADGRDEGGKKGENQKGLVEFDHKTRKDAFYHYKAAWSKEPFVHICGKRYINRAEKTTKIKVYSNCGNIALYADGKLLEEKAGERVFVFEVPLSGRHHIEARSGEHRDETEICFCDEPDPSYIFGTAGKVVNWFDKEEIKEGYFSIKDSFGALLKNPKTAAIVGRIMAKASASRGDVAKETNANQALQKMMAGLSLESLLKKAGANVISPEQIKAINDALQQIPKEEMSNE